MSRKEVMNLEKKWLEHLKGNKKQKKISYNDFKIKIHKEKKKSFIDHKRPEFETKHFVNERMSSVKLERFGKIAERIGVNSLIIQQIYGKWYTLEMQQINIEKGAENKRIDGYFADVEGIEYYKDETRKITMTGSYFNGFHYFKYEEDAKEIAELLIGTNLFYKIIDILVYNSNARGEMHSIETHVTNSFYII